MTRTGVEPLLAGVHDAPELALVDLDDIELVRGLRLKRAVDVPVVIREAADVQPAVEAGQIARDLAGGHVDLADAIRIGHIHIAQIIVYAHALQMAGADLGVVLLRIARRHVGRVIAGLALRAVQRLLPLVAGNAVTGEAAAAVMAQQLIMSTNARSRQMLRFAIFFIVSSFVPFDTSLSYRNPSQETADNFVRLAKISSVFTASYISIPAFWADCIVLEACCYADCAKAVFYIQKP